MDKEARSRDDDPRGELTCSPSEEARENRPGLHVAELLRPHVYLAAGGGAGEETDSVRVRSEPAGNRRHERALQSRPRLVHRGDDVNCPLHVPHEDEPVVPPPDRPAMESKGGLNRHH